MKSVRKYYSGIAALALCLFAAVSPASGFQVETPQMVRSVRDEKTAGEFEKRAQNYAKMREEIESQLPRLPRDATPEQIDAHKEVFQKSVQTARRRVRRGEIFTLAAARLIRSIIRTELKGKERAEFKETVFESDTKGVIIKVNNTYPETKELVEMPPSLLLSLPQLPKQLRYRFVGRSLLLVDRENSVIVDYMTNALP